MWVVIDVSVKYKALNVVLPGVTTQDTQQIRFPYVVKTQNIIIYADFAFTG